MRLTLTCGICRFFAVAGGLLAVSCGSGKAPSQVIGDFDVHEQPKSPCSEPLEGFDDASLADAFADHFTVGVALNPSVFVDGDEKAVGVVVQQYNRISPENVLKWDAIQPVEGRFNFAPADAYVEFGEAHDQEIHGHTLVWHQQTPNWVFAGEDGKPATRELVLERLEAHVAALAERYGSRITSWDVVNEALEDTGELRVSPWRTGIGDDYIEQAFAIADRYFPDAKLVYNDYNMEQTAKVAGAIKLGKTLREAGLRVDAIGLQSHYGMSQPSVGAIETALQAYEDAGFEVLLTELDLDVLSESSGNPYEECLPADIDENVALRWAEVFRAFVRYSDVISSVTFWGVDDGQSWLNNHPDPGRKNYSLLFDRELRPKTAYASVLEQAEAD